MQITGDGCCRRPTRQRKLLRATYRGAAAGLGQDPCLFHVAIEESPSTIWRLVKRYFRKARIKADGMGPHALRHTFATLLLNKGENLRVIQVLMSHKSLATTARYLHTRSEELVSAVNSLQLREDPITAKEAARPSNIHYYGTTTKSH